MSNVALMFLEPNQIVNSLEIEPGMAVADFGAGSGFYALAMAKKVGDKGRVYAFDVQKTALDIIRSKAKLFHFFNVDAIRADLEKDGATNLKEGIIDLVFISNILFQSQNKKNLIAEAKRILKPKAKIAIVEWEKIPSKFGPPLESRVSADETEQLMNEAGFKRKKEFYAGDSHYGLLFEKEV